MHQLAQLVNGYGLYHQYLPLHPTISLLSRLPSSSQPYQDRPHSGLCLTTPAGHRGRAQWRDDISLRSSRVTFDVRFCRILVMPYRLQTTKEHHALCH